MDTLRAIIRWIEKHRVLSGVSAVLVVLGILAARAVAFRSEGTLSEPVQRQEIIDAVYGIGTVTATRSFSIKPGVISTIRDLYVKEGDSVHKSQRLARIDGVVYSSPLDGVVNFLPFKEGENIFAQLPMMVVTDLLNRYLVVSLEQQGALRVRPGQRAKLSFDTIRDQTYDGVVESVYSYNSNFLSRINVTKLPPQILPDMTADVAIIIQDLKDVLAVPVTALDGKSVWVKRGSRLPSKTPVTIGVVDGLMAQVVSGDLQPGDRVMSGRKLAK